MRALSLSVVVVVVVNGKDHAFFALISLGENSSATSWANLKPRQTKLNPTPNFTNSIQTQSKRLPTSPSLRSFAFSSRSESISIFFIVINVIVRTVVCLFFKILFYMLGYSFIGTSLNVAFCVVVMLKIAIKNAHTAECKRNFPAVATPKIQN